MTDLVQKIADAVEVALGDDGHSVVYKNAAVREAIRQALADAGGAVAHDYEMVILEGGLVCLRGELRHPAGTKLYTHPDSGRVAELEAQLAESREQVWEFAERLTATRRALCDVRLKTREGSIVWKIADATLAADKEKNDAK